MGIMSERMVKLRIEGMSCGGCVGRVEGAIAGVAGVKTARVNLTTESAAVDLTEDASVDAVIEAVRLAGYEAERARTAADRLAEIEANHATKTQRQKQAVVQAVGLATPIIALEWFGTSLESGVAGGHVWWRVLQALLCAMLILSPAGGPIIASGIRAAFHRAPNMDLLVTLGVLTAFISSVIGIFIGAGAQFNFHAAAMILAFINLGKYFETRARREASSSITDLAKRVPTSAVLVRDGQTETVSVDDVAIGDHVRVDADVAVPVDGRIVQGSAAIDQSVITGESMPVGCSVGDEVFGGAIVREGTIIIETTALGQDSTMGRILRAVEDAQSGKTRMQGLADRVAGVFVPIVVLIAVATVAGWMVAGFTLGNGLNAATAVLVIACPCAMGLATPTAVMVASGVAAAKGILLRDASALEEAGRLTKIVFDKTGTLTEGQPIIARISPVEGFDETTLLRLAASADRFSQHPLAKAIVSEAERRDITLIDPVDFESQAGFGVSARVEGRTILIGSRKFMQSRGLSADFATQKKDEAATAVTVAVDGVVAGQVFFVDAVRPSAADAIAALRHRGLTISMVTGDRESTAQHVADALGLDTFTAEATPDEKCSIIQATRDSGEVVAFVGDGVNDAPALAAAHVGISFAAGTDIANAASDITLVGSNLTSIPFAVALADRSVRIIKQNLFWAFAYNLAAVPLAATGRVSPGIAAAAMMMSSISVVLNSLRLRSSRALDTKSA